MPTVLYVDHDRDYSSYMSAVLPSYGITCHSVKNYPLALQKLSTMRFDCLICEWTMPFQDGRELIRLLAQHREGIPILVVTDKTKDHVLPLAMEAGALLVLEKPYSAQELAHTINRLTWSRVPTTAPCFSAAR